MNTWFNVFQELVFFLSDGDFDTREGVLVIDVVEACVVVREVQGPVILGAPQLENDLLAVLLLHDRSCSAQSIAEGEVVQPSRTAKQRKPWFWGVYREARRGLSHTRARLRAPHVPKAKR